MEHTKIQWADHTFNPWEGCTKVSDGCKNCYAEARNSRFNKGAAINWGKGAPRRRTKTWGDPVKWNKAENRLVDHAEFNAGHRPRVFCASLADWLDEEVPTAWLHDLLQLIRETPNLDWLLLSKRPENWSARINEAMIMADNVSHDQHTANWLARWLHGQPPANVWIGTTCENQAIAEKRIPVLLSIPARVRFLSCEPLLGPVNLAYTLFNLTDSFGQMPGIHWVIAGGESGAGARFMNPDWARDLRDQCANAGVPFLFKQWGAQAEGNEMDGRQHLEFPTAK